jgi:hypothetical protein
MASPSACRWWLVNPANVTNLQAPRREPCHCHKPWP